MNRGSISQRRLAAIAGARAGVGTRFRAQGRSIGLGLDCVGVAMLAATAAGVRLGPVPAYDLGGDHGDLMADTISALGLRQQQCGQPGDVIAFALAPGHRHLAVISERGIIHAHAGLGRVVEGPVPADWTVAGCWALPGLE